MKKIKLFLKGDVVCTFDNVQAMLMRKDHTLEILVGDKWIIIQPEEYDWFTLL